jgi:non-ribosomal peptide synthetase component F
MIVVHLSTAATLVDDADRDGFDAPFATIPDLICRHATERPSQIAVLQDDAQGRRRLDYAAFDGLADRIAATLQRDGVRPRETVTICAASCRRGKERAKDAPPPAAGQVLGLRTGLPLTNPR